MQLEKLLDIHQTLVINCSNRMHSVEINFVSEERSMYMQIACNKNLNSLLQKIMFGFQFDQLNCWSYYLQETLNPARGQSRTTLFSFIFLLHTCDNLMQIVDFGIT